VDHYFDIYHAHFARFRGTDVHILEIGIYSGGSLAMWKQYFGPGSHIYGVDIEEACKVYEDDATRVFIGDQADREFWLRFRQHVPQLDIVIDDGGHQREQQIVSLEELLPHLRPGGVYACEDLSLGGFVSYITGFIQNLNWLSIEENPDDNERRLVSRPSALQSEIASITFHPMVTVIEKRAAPITEFVCPKHGSKWVSLKGTGYRKGVSVRLSKWLRP
jgi:hypothetical protein